ncbi:MAG: cupredoxin domain-containing protein [Actinomycetota bacterium]
MTSKPTTKPGLMTIAAVGLLVALTGCGSSATTASSASGATPSHTSSPASTPGNPSLGAASSPAAPQAAEPVLITIKDFAYILPASVASGAKIMVKNQDNQSHTVTSTPKGAFAIKVDGGGTASFTAPAKPGSYQFACDFHANMMGTLVVK